MEASVRVETPMSKNDPTEVKVEEIPLPPPEMWEALDNSPKPKAAAPTAAAPAPTRRKFDQLAFKGGEVTRSIPLQFSFDHPEMGDVTQITVRRLTVGEVGELIDTRDPEAPDFFDIYARMCGMPETVLRGLIDVDGEAVTGVCYDFLPRLFRPVRADASSSTSPTGEE